MFRPDKVPCWWKWPRCGHSGGQRSEGPPELFVCPKAWPILTWLLRAARWRSLRTATSTTPSTRPLADRGTASRRGVIQRGTFVLFPAFLSGHTSADHSPAVRRFAAKERKFNCEGINPAPGHLAKSGSENRAESPFGDSLGKRPKNASTPGFLTLTR